MSDEKDLEIARLSGKIEALEGELAKERLARTFQQIVTPLIPVIPNAPYRWIPPYDPPVYGPEYIYSGNASP